MENILKLLVNDYANCCSTQNELLYTLPHDRYNKKIREEARSWFIKVRGIIMPWKRFFRGQGVMTYKLSGNFLKKWLMIFQV